MHIPRYWARGSCGMPGDDPRKITCWGWSETSPEDARQVGTRRAEKTVERILKKASDFDGYPYGRNRPIKEEILSEIRAPDGALAALLTRNSYGAAVLNTARVMFLDADLPEQNAGAAVTGLFSWFLGQKKKPDPKSELQSQFEANCRRLGLGVRLYETANGFRGLVTSALYEPDSDAALDLLESMECDPLYIRLCKNQKCFRARLTPKPWRCRLERPPGRYPYESESLRLHFSHWLSRYTALLPQFATCRFLHEINPPQNADPAIAQITALHDQASQAHENLPLA